MASSSELNDDRILQIARVMHEAVRAFQTAIGQPAAPPWHKAPKWMKTASRDGVIFRIEHPDAPPSAQHDQWMQDKLRDGWTFGAEKDPVRKTHPLLVPYEDLSFEERQKDALVAAVVKSLSQPL